MASFGLLGPLRADLGGLAGVAHLPPKQRIVLACLLLSANRVVPLDRLIHALWDDPPPPSARVTTQGYVKSLRNVLADSTKSRIITVEPGYLIVVRDEELDLDGFRRLRDAGRAAVRARDWVTGADTLRAALGIWRGEPLLDVPSSVLQRDEVPALTEAKLQTLELCMDAELSLGRHTEITAELRRLTSAHPLREKFYAQLMLALFRCGLQAEAVDTYRRLRRLLASELGIEPGPELRDLHQRMLAGDAALRSADGGGVTQLALPEPPRQLPPAVPDFTGRAAQVGRLLDRHVPARDAVTISVIIGSGGIGKTTLAVHVAHRLATAFPDGQLYASLQDNGLPVRPGIVLGRFLTALGLPDAAVPADDADRAARFRTLLAGRRVLIVLDDARHASQVLPLLPGSAGCAVIVTSRHMLPELAGAALLLLGVMDQDEASSLFDVIAGPERAAREPDMVTAVLGYCGGLPLAVRIAATRLASRPAWPVASLAARLAGERDRLSELVAGDLAVRPTFSISYQLQAASDPRAAETFVLLGLAEMATICVAAAAALTGRGAQETRQSLELLADAQLVASAGAGRYQMHDLLRIYAAELAARSDDQSARRAGMRRMLEWYCARAVASGVSHHASYYPPGTSSEITFGSAQQAVQWCDAELANLATATRRAAELGMHDLAARIPAALCWFFHRYPFHAEWLTSHEIALASARRIGDIYSEGYLLHTLGKMHATAGRRDAADRCFEAALTIRRALDDPAGLGRVLNTMGIACLAARQPDLALRHLEQALDIATSHGTAAEAAVASRTAAKALRQLGDYARAADSIALAIKLFRQAGERYGEGIAEPTAGEIRADAGQPNIAIGHLRRALAILSYVNPDDVLRANGLCKLAQVYASLGEHSPEAQAAWGEALTIYQRYGDPRAAYIAERLVGAGTHS